MTNSKDKFYQPVPEDFEFKPACGTVDKDGGVMVSGVNMTTEQIDQGRDLYELDQVFSEIENNLKEKEKKKE